MTKDANGEAIPERVKEYIQGAIEGAAAGDSDLEVGVDPADGTEAIWDDDNEIIVVLGNGPNRPGTSFHPDTGRDYFDENFSGRPRR